MGPGLLDQLDGILASVRDKGAVGELRFTEDQILPRSASDYVAQNVWFGISFPQLADVEAARDRIGVDRVMWGSDFPHDEGTHPFTTEALRQVFHDWPEDELRKVLGGNAADLYGFDLAALDRAAAEVGPRVDEVARPLDELPPDPNEALLRNARASAA